MNTDNKARLIEVLDKAIREIPAVSMLEYNRDLADRIEASGLLAGSVVVPSVEEIEEILAKNSVTKAPESMEDFGSFWRPDFQKYVAKAIHAHLLTRSPEPKGRWISEEEYQDKSDHIAALQDALALVGMPREVSEVYRGTVPPDQADIEWARAFIEKSTAPRAKEE